jgi:signal transduction histidine kinase
MSSSLWNRWPSGRLISARLGGIVTICLVVGTFLAFQYRDASRAEDQQTHLVRSNQWIVSQLQREILKFLTALERYRLGDEAVDQEQLILRFDLLWSRVPLLLVGPESAAAREVAGMAQTARALKADLETVDPEVARLKHGDRSAGAEIAAIFRPYERRTHDLLMAFRQDDHKLVAAMQAAESRARYSLAGIAGVVALLLLALMVELVHRQRLYAERQRGQARAEAANTAKSRFLANMSHELRTPLNAIVGFSEVLKGEVFGPLGNTKYRSYAEDIHSSAHHLNAILSDVLDMAKAEAGAISLEEEDIAPGELLDWCKRMSSSDAANRGLALSLDTAGLPSGVQLRADARLLRQIVLNLMSNAIKHGPRGSIVRLVCRIEAGELLVEVEDEGPGIPTEELSRVTESFVQLSAPDTSNSGGAGLGLALVRTFAELHGGHLELESAPCVGTRARVRFPSSRVHGVEGPKRAA